MHEMRNTAKNLASNGGGRLPSTAVSCSSWEGDDTAGSFVSMIDLTGSMATQKQRSITPVKWREREGGRERNLEEAGSHGQRETRFKVSTTMT
jgi:hypothetical protein